MKLFTNDELTEIAQRIYDSTGMRLGLDDEIPRKWREKVAMIAAEEAVLALREITQQKAQQ